MNLITLSRMNCYSRRQDSIMVQTDRREKARDKMAKTLFHHKSVEWAITTHETLQGCQEDIQSKLSLRERGERRM